MIIFTDFHSIKPDIKEYSIFNLQILNILNKEDSYRERKMNKIAIISVSDKSCLDILLPSLMKFNVEILSSGGTAHHIRQLGFRVLEVSEYTGYPEMPRGLVKTLHPKIHGGILGDRGDLIQREYMDQQGIKEIDLVVVNFYPFELETSKEMDLKKVAEFIDIGGPALVRAAAKAALLYGRVVVLTRPDQYTIFVDDFEKNHGTISDKLKKKLAQEAFAATLSYDKSILQYLKSRIDENEYLAY